MRVKEILSLLDEISPFSLQESWDNSGLQVGSFNQKIEKIFLCIDVDEELIDTLPSNSLLITHHPLIFSKLRSIEFSSYPSKLIAKLIKKDIALIAMHTNFDKTHLNRYVAKNVLQVEPECEEFICYFARSVDFDKALHWVSEAFGLVAPRYVRAKEQIERIALTTGSGGGLLDFVKADLFLTGDLKYHDAMKAKMLGINIIDIGHFESERYFGEALKEQLQRRGIKAIIASIKNPLEVGDERVY